MNARPSCLGSAGGLRWGGTWGSQADSFPLEEAVTTVLRASSDCEPALWLFSEGRLSSTGGPRGRTRLEGQGSHMGHKSAADPRFMTL